MFGDHAAICHLAPVHSTSTQDCSPSFGADVMIGMTQSTAKSVCRSIVSV